MLKNEFTLDNSIEESLQHNDFRLHVEGGWNNVYPPVKARMDKLLTSPTDTVFAGKGCVRRSKIGLIFAYLSKILGTPLVFNQGENVLITVKVSPTSNGRRCWNRSFEFSDSSKQIVETTKIVDPKLGFIDAVGSEGEKLLATKMKVRTEGKSLFFESTCYLLRFKYFNVVLPSILTPGTLKAEHRDEGNGNFRYILSFEHSIYGETFYQDGIFREKEE